VSRFSLRRRLTLLLLTSLVLVWGGMLVVSYREAQEEVDELFDARLEEGARALMLVDLKRLRELSDVEGLSAIVEDDDDDDDRDKQIIFQVWDADGSLVLRTHDAPEVAFDEQNGFDTTRAQGQLWRTFATWNERHGFQVRVFERLTAREDLVGDVAGRMMTPLLFAVPLLALIIWFSIERGLNPLRTLSSAIGARDAANLDPVRLDRVPKEVEPLVDSLNDLLQRVSRSIENERRFTADAAHELRTPLAAIKVQAEVALGAEEPAKHRGALLQIIEGVNRTTHLVQQLLTLARLDHPEATALQPVDLGDLAAQCAARYAESALQKALELSVSAEPDCVVGGDSTTLEVMIGNLIDNAIRYTQEQGRVEIAVKKNSETILLSVKDNGPGVPDADRRRVLDRFYRAEGNRGPGSGLGLSIVERITSAHHAGISIGKGLEGKGFGVSVLFRPKGH
jgi:two-component system, OmpR family, sensor histidine kinase QseC